MHTLYISVGSNIDPRRHVEQAMAELRQCFDNVQQSSLYESQSVGFDGDNFINLVVKADTDMPIHQVVDSLHAIEARHGRDRHGPKFSSRTLDLDLLLYDDVTCKTDGIHVPREEILYNAFVLYPLAELAPDLIHPTERQSMAQLWQQFDKGKQKIWKVE
ncbi:MAG: 2-amino-4-hydroxy-6-hydroxymethyldihydropteridine diphosphokinase [Gammaproteobacteria bacterium]